MNENISKLPSNDNWKPESRPAIELQPTLNGAHIAAIRSKVADFEETHPGFITMTMMEEVRKSISNFTNKDVISLINSFNPQALEDRKIPMYKALLERLFIEEVPE